MQERAIKHKKEQIIYPELPLAIYREIAAHLQQVEGIKTTLIPQQSQQFNYNESQVSGLLIEYSADFDSRNQEPLEEVLTYYAQHYGACQRQLLPL